MVLNINAVLVQILFIGGFIVALSVLPKALKDGVNDVSLPPSPIVLAW